MYFKHNANVMLASFTYTFAEFHTVRDLIQTYCSFVCQCYAKNQGDKVLVHEYFILE